MSNVAATRYLTSTGVDLSSVFMARSFGGPCPETGYKLSNGNDLNTLFCKNYTDVYADKTNILISDGQDLSDIFETNHPTGNSSYLTKLPVIRVVYPLTTSSTYYGGDASSGGITGTFGVWGGLLIREIQL